MGRLLRGKKVQIIFSKEGLTFVSDEFFTGSIERQKPQLCCVLQENHERDVLNDRLGQCVGFPQLLLDPLARRNVGECHHGLDKRTCVVSNRVGITYHPGRFGAPSVTYANNIVF